MGFYKLTEILRKSPGEFQHLLGTFEQFCMYAKQLDRIPPIGNGSDDALSDLRGHIFRVLNEFFSRTRGFSKYLGSGRDRFALSKVVHKIKWATQVENLNGLLGELRVLVDLITSHLVIDTRYTSLFLILSLLSLSILNEVVSCVLNHLPILGYRYHPPCIPPCIQFQDRWMITLHSKTHTAKYTHYPLAVFLPGRFVNILQAINRFLRFLAP